MRLPLQLLLLLAALCLPSPSALAQTPVGGTLNADTVWRQAQSPYLLSGELLLQGGATLTIEAGATIQMAPDARLTVQSGKLLASGNAQSPILFTSQRAQNGQTPAPGDWGQILFQSGTDPASRLEYVKIEYGKGIALRGAAPTFNFVAINHNQGAAIDADLASSPAGYGNSASGNGVNAVLLPAGEVVGSVTWGLRGIPYFVPTGTVSVGAAPGIDSVVPDSVKQGESVVLTLDGSRLAGLADAKFDLAGLTATVLAGGGDSQARLQVTAKADAALGVAALSALVDAGELRRAAALTVLKGVPPPTPATIVPDALRRGETRAVEVGGTDLDGSTLSASGAGLSISGVTLTATKASFTLSASAGAALGQQRIVFSKGSVSASIPVTVNAALPQATVSPATLAVPPDGSARNFALQLSFADANSHSFAVSVADPSLASVSTPSLTIAAGQVQAIGGLTGLKAGNTSLVLESATLGKLTVALYVTTDYLGLSSTSALPVGVVLAAPPAALPASLVAPNLGVVLQSGGGVSGSPGLVQAPLLGVVKLEASALPAGTAIIAPNVGIVLGEGGASPAPPPGMVLAPAVGVNLEAAPPPASGQAVANPVGVSK